MSIGPLVSTPEIERIDPELEADELDALVQFLDYHRATIRLKCAGLDDEQLKRRPLAPSTLSLLGLVRHLSEVEHHWFARTLDGQATTELYCTDADPDGDFDRLDSAPVAEVWASYDAVVAESRRIQTTFGAGSEPARDTGQPRTVRWVLIHLIEEYARHNGHADLLRELIDGATGE